ncbi:MAG: hypothetical protein DYH08_10690 [Actinobacteria bacterium ATB1]|nr:hypothetical protein [Actinobacteria bacterium ATB1]
MRSVVSWLSGLSSRRPGWTVIAVALLTVVLGGLASQQEMSNDNKDFLPDNDTARALDELQTKFKTASSIPSQVVVEADNVFDPEVVAEVLEIEQVIREDPEIARHLIADPQKQTFSYADMLLMAAGGDMATLSQTPTDELLARLPESAQASIGATTAERRDDGSAGAALILANLDFSHEEEDVEAAEVHLADTVESGDYENVDVRVFNQGVLQEVLDEGQRETGPLFLLAMGLILVILIILYRTFSDVALGMVALVLTVVWMYGLGVLVGPGYLGWTGPFNSMTVMIPVLLVGMAIDYAIHITSRYREELVYCSPDRPRQAIKPAILTVGAALVLATITTAVGFLTNLTSPLPPIQDFGVFVTLGIVAAFVVMTTFIPSIRVLLDGRRVRKGRGLETKRVADTVPGASIVLEKIADVADRRPGISVAVGVAITAVCPALTTNLSTAFSSKDFIPQDNEVYDTLVFLEDEFRSRGDTATVLVRADMTDPEVFAAMRETNKALGSVVGVAGSVQPSVVTLAEDWATLNPDLPQDPYSPAVENALDKADESGGPEALFDALGEVAPDALAATLNPEMDRAALVVPLQNLSSHDENRALRDGLVAAATPLTDLGGDAVPTSEGIVVFEVMDTLRASQIQSIVTTVVGAAIVLLLYFGFYFRRPGLGLLAVLPVCLTMAWVLGTMVLLDLSFNVLTAMITALSIGIGVPYSIHVINRFLEDLERHPDVREALHSTMGHTGGALLGSALTTIVGFGVLIFSSLAPMRQFGGLTALTILYALIASVAVLPPFLVLWGRRERRRMTGVDLTEDASSNGNADGNGKGSIGRSAGSAAPAPVSTEV